MMKIDDGGPVYPRTENVRDPNSYPSPEYIEKQYFGMSLRDLMAAHAITGIMASSEWFESLINARSKLEAKSDTKKSVSGIAAIMAYEIADAMIKARGVSSHEPARNQRP